MMIQAYYVCIWIKIGVYGDFYDIILLLWEKVTDARILVLDLLDWILLIQKKSVDNIFLASNFVHVDTPSALHAFLTNPCTE